MSSLVILAASVFLNIVCKNRQTNCDENLTPPLPSAWVNIN